LLIITPLHNREKEEKTDERSNNPGEPERDEIDTETFEETKIECSCDRGNRDRVEMRMFWISEKIKVSSPERPPPLIVIELTDILEDLGSLNREVAVEVYNPRKDEDYKTEENNLIHL